MRCRILKVVKMWRKETLSELWPKDSKSSGTRPSGDWFIMSIVGATHAHRPRLKAQKKSTIRYIERCPHYWCKQDWNSLEILCHRQISARQSAVSGTRPGSSSSSSSSSSSHRCRGIHTCSPTRHNVMHDYLWLRHASWVLTPCVISTSMTTSLRHCWQLQAKRNEPRGKHWDLPESHKTVQSTSTSHKVGAFPKLFA